MKNVVKSAITIIGFLSLGLCAAVLSRNIASFEPSTVQETVAPHGLARSDHVDQGLGIRINSTGIEFTVPNCDAEPWQDNMFVHIYVRGKRHASPQDFVNMDFNIKTEIGKAIRSGKPEQCRIIKSFRDFEVASVALGQFNTPEGKCCTIVWSRYYKMN